MHGGYESDDMSESNMLKRRHSATDSITSSLSQASNGASLAVVIDNSTSFMEKYRKKPKAVEVALQSPLLPEATNISASEVPGPNVRTSSTSSALLALGVVLPSNTLRLEVEDGVANACIEETQEEFMESAPGLAEALQLLYKDHEHHIFLGPTERRHWVTLNGGAWTENEGVAYSFGSSLGSIPSSGRLQFVLLTEILRLRRTTEKFL